MISKTLSVQEYNDYRNSNLFKFNQDKCFRWG